MQRTASYVHNCYTLTSISHTSRFCILLFLLLCTIQLESDHFYVHEFTLVFLQKGVFQLDVKSMTPSDINPGGGAEDPQRLDSRTGSGNEAVLSRSPIRKISQQGNKTRPSLQQRNEKLSVDTKGRKSENSRRSSRSDGGSNKEKILNQNSKTILPKKPKPPVAPQAGGNSSHNSSSSSSSSKRPVSGDSSKEEDSNSRTSSSGGSDLSSSILPSAYVARMVSMIERRGGTPPPVPTSARPKLKPMADQQPEEGGEPSNMIGNSNQFAKKFYTTLNGSSALAKPVPLSQHLNLTSTSNSRGTFTTHMEERQREGEQNCQDDSSATSTTTTTYPKGTAKSSTKHKRLAPDRMESVILLSSNSRSQNLWNTRLQSSVRLLSGPHFTFNVI
jgi:hypothetical protein